MENKEKKKTNTSKKVETTAKKTTVKKNETAKKEVSSKKSAVVNKKSDTKKNSKKKIKSISFDYDKNKEKKATSSLNKTAKSKNKEVVKSSKPKEDKVVSKEKEVAADNITKMNNKILDNGVIFSKDESLAESIEQQDNEDISEVNTDKPNKFLFLEKEEVDNDNREEERLRDKNVVIYPISNKKHISFEARISLLILAMFFSFFVAFLFIFQAFTYKDINDITFTEKAIVSYQVCQNENDYYRKLCSLENGKYYADSSEIIPVAFEYNAVYTDEVPYHYNYYVISKLNISDKNDSENILYNSEEVLVERTKLDGKSKNINFFVNTDVPFKEYYEYVKNYNQVHSLDTNASVEVALYIDDENTGRKISSVEIPLGESTFSITKNGIYNENQIITSSDSTWNEYNTAYASFGSLFALVGLCVIIYLTNLVCKSLNHGSIYQRKLKQILNEYDRFIVISRGEYTLADGVRVIKVASFSELMDARNALEKPIVYVRVNNVKSEFYVEDTNKVYLYIMKEADFEGK